MTYTTKERNKNPRVIVGDANYEAVRWWYKTHLGGTQRECAEALALSVMTVNRHVHRMRKKWLDEGRGVARNEA